jgi:2-C-methyl-D-erythritol 4-phosphate cytidylyltransferase
MQDLKKYALIVAGGTGTRMGAGIPKQFLPLNGLPVLMHAINAFKDISHEIILVLPAEHIAEWQNLCSSHTFTIVHTLVEGGASRFHSVKNGLEKVEPESLVAVHDGVRPLVSPELINMAYLEAIVHKAVIPAVPLSESIRQKTETGTMAVPRDNYLIVQTPQTFNSTLLKKAYETPFKDFFTDDASVVEHSGHSVKVIGGENNNIKITIQKDLLLAEALMKG